MAVRIAALYLVSTLLLLIVLAVVLDRSTEGTLTDGRRQDLLAYAGDNAAFVERAVSRESDLLTLAPAIAASLPHTGGGPRSLRVFSSNGTLLAALPPDPQGGAGRPSQATLDLLPIGLLSLTMRPADDPGLIYAAAPIHGLTAVGQQ